MRIFQILIISILFTLFGCSFIVNNDKNGDKASLEEKINIYAENGKGGFVLIQTDNNGNGYFRMRGANYSNHYYGKINKENGIISFIADKAIRINSCKSRKYGTNIIGLEFGNDEKALAELKKFNILYEVQESQVEKINLNGLHTYIEIPKQEEVTVIIESDTDNFFKSERIVINPETTMLCISSKIRLGEYKFEINGNDIIALNYFGRPQKYILK